MNEVPDDAVITATRQVDLPDWIYQIYVDAANATGQQWVRLVIAKDREKGQAGGLIYSGCDQILALKGTRVGWDSLETIAQVEWPASKYLKDEVSGPWTRAVIIIDATGYCSCTLHLVEDDDHLPTVNYIHGDSDPIWNHADEHQDELVAIARQVYGTDTGTTH